jgi:hypothetical protein
MEADGDKWGWILDGTEYKITKSRGISKASVIVLGETPILLVRSGTVPVGTWDAGPQKLAADASQIHPEFIVTCSHGMVL